MKKIIILILIIILWDSSGYSQGDLLVGGKVGIGTFTPTAPLDIATPIKVKVTPEGYLQIGNNPPYPANITVANNNGVTYLTTGSFGLGFFMNTTVGASVEISRGRGTLSAPTPVLANSWLFSYDLYAQYGYNPGEGAYVGRFGAQMLSVSGAPNTWKAKTFFHVAQVDLGLDVVTNLVYIPPSASFGIGTQSPVEKVDISGALKIGNTTSNCTSSNAGTLKYVSNNFYGCNGSSWVLLN